MNKGPNNISETDNKGDIRSIESLNETSESQGTSALIAGFPKELCSDTINEFFADICPNNKVTVMTKGKSKFKGMVFVLFATIEEATEFTKKELVYKGKMLDIKLAIDTDDFIQNCLEDLRHPKKVYINKIPKNFEKNQIVETFSQFGEVHQVNIIHRTDRVNNFAYVTFVDSKSAVETVNHKFLELEEDFKIRISYAKPNFTKRMLFKVNPALRNYLKKIQNGKKEYDPADFIQFEQTILKKYENYKDPTLADEVYQLKEDLKKMQISDPSKDINIKKEKVYKKEFKSSKIDHQSNLKSTGLKNKVKSLETTKVIKQPTNIQHNNSTEYYTKKNSGIGSKTCQSQLNDPITTFEYDQHTD